MSINPTGSFCWFELATSNQSAAKAFYTSLFGWTVDDSPMGPDEYYSMFKLGGQDAGAGYTLRADQRQHGVPPHWMVYVAVTDADAAAARARSLGATELAAAFDVMEHGRMAVLQDPQGATFCVWQSKQHTGVGVKGVVGSVSWCELSTPNQAAGGKFYEDLFGWKMVTGRNMTPAKPGDYYHIVNGNDMIGGVAPPEQRDANAPPHWLIYFEVGNCAATTAKAKSAGATVYLDSMDVGENGIVSVIADSQGAAFGIHQSK
jgi:predicted enzyme related to lactoylglutathione lyase